MVQMTDEEACDALLTKLSPEDRHAWMMSLLLYGTAIIDQGGRVVSLEEVYKKPSDQKETE